MIFNVFFIHHSQMREREVTMTNFRAALARHAFAKGIKLGKVANVEAFDPAGIDVTTIQKTVSYQPYPEGHPMQKYNAFTKNLHVHQLSNSLKHLKALEVIMNDCPDGSLNLVLEDDVSFDPNQICGILDKAMKLYETGSMLFLGLPNNRQNVQEMVSIPTKELFEIIPYNDSYLIDKATATTIANAWLPIKYLTNIQFTHVAEKAGVRTMQTIPNVFVDGSKIGMFTSSINPNNILMFNHDYMQLRELAMKEEELTEDEKNKGLKLIEAPISQHPDFMYITGLFHQKIGEYEKALKIYENTHEMYKRNMCIINHESQFLKDYIKIHKHFQEESI